MKKILLATTVLAASSSVAFAEMSVSGAAEIGIDGGTGMETQLHTDIDVNFTGSGETDSGLTFGFSIDLDESIGDANNQGGLESQATRDDSKQGGETIFISGNFGTLTWGDTDGAFDWAMTEVNIGGSINDAETSHAGFNGNAGLDGDYDGQIVRYDYSFGDFSVGGSVEMDDTFGTTNDPIFGLGAKFSTSLASLDLGVGLGYQTDGTTDIFGLSMDTTFSNGLMARLNYSDLDGMDGYDDHMAIGLGYATGPITVGFNYGVYNLVGGGDESGYGLAADYDLGGGAEIQFGYGYSDFGGGVDADLFSLGVAMSF